MCRSNYVASYTSYTKKYFEITTSQIKNLVRISRGGSEITLEECSFLSNFFPHDLIDFAMKDFQTKAHTKHNQKYLTILYVERREDSSWL